MIIIKNNNQIDGIRKSCKIAAETLYHIEKYITEGISTKELNSIAESFIRSKKAIPAPLGYNGYPSATCISVNDTICHGIPNDYKLKNGDIVKIDISTIYNGFFGDTCYTFPVGKISPIAEKLINVTKMCLDVGIKQIKPYNYTGNIGYEIERLANSNGFSVNENYYGHGVGLSLHEEPSIPHASKKNTGYLMMPGMIFTCEPMINEGSPHNYVVESDNWTVKTLDAKLSAQFEHSILVTSNGHEILT